MIHSQKNTFSHAQLISTSIFSYMYAKVTVESAAPVKVDNSLFIQYVNNKIQGNMPSSGCSFAVHGGGGLHTFVGNQVC